MSDSKNFEETMTELEAIVKQLESGNLSLDEALRLYEQGIKLSNHGNQLLEGAEQRLEELKKVSNP